MLNETVRSKRCDLDYNRVEKDESKILEVFSKDKPVCLVRAGDAEMYILDSRRVKNPITLQKNVSTRFIKNLALSLQKADLVGLPDDYISVRHKYGWDDRIIASCSKLGVCVEKDERVVSALFFYVSPDTLTRLASGKKLLIINHKANAFKDLIKDPKWREYYSFNSVESLSCVEIPDGKGGWIFEKSMDAVVKDVIQQIECLDFDIAFIGAGAMANVLALHIRDVLGKKAIDCGAILSAMRGQANRVSFRKYGKNAHLVWKRSFSLMNALRFYAYNWLNLINSPNLEDAKCLILGEENQ